MVLSSRDLIDSINAEEERRYVESYRFMEEQKIKKALAPAQWEEFKQTLEDSVRKTGAVSPVIISFESDYPDEAVLRNQRNGRIARLIYNPDVPCVQYQTPTKSGTYTFRLNTGGTILQFMDGARPKLTGELAYDIIRTILH
jgi:hypothetical protein